jgi:catechol 2,3-dioxygenase-like lactoylglutathione lyase family enzyme
MPIITPVLRFFDLPRTLEFYKDWLGFKVDWEHRFGDNFPLYMALSKGNILIHLSEHHGDGNPCTRLLILYEGDLKTWHQALKEKDYKYFKPAVGKSDWNKAEMSLLDPVGNQLVFFQPE